MVGLHRSTAIPRTALCSNFVVEIPTEEPGGEAVLNASRNVVKQGATQSGLAARLAAATRCMASSRIVTLYANSFQLGRTNQTGNRINGDDGQGRAQRRNGLPAFTRFIKVLRVRLDPAERVRGGGRSVGTRSLAGALCNNAALLFVQVPVGPIRYQRERALKRRAVDGTARATPGSSPLRAQEVTKVRARQVLFLFPRLPSGPNE